VKFYLVRHGEAVPANQNPQRPLTQAGRQEVERVAQLAGARNIQVSVIFHSGILRAKETAEILAAQLHPEIDVRQLDGLLPEDDPMIAKAELEVAQQSIMLVGHLPHMKRLAALLVAGDPQRDVVDFGPATMICLSYENSQWKIAEVLS
jgi:phosphohistidine phosphatase